MIKKQEIMELVKEEADNIKKYATPEEIAKLNVNAVNGGSPSQCIYGLMTDRCTTDRAHELIGLCARKVYIRDQSSNRLNILNGHSSEVNVIDSYSRYAVYVSPIERLIFSDVGHNVAARSLVRYIKGETDTINYNLEEWEKHANTE